jgi:alkaline phosphatase D
LHKGIFRTMRALVLFLFLLPFSSSAQPLFLCRPLQGATTDSTAKLWVEVAPKVIKLEAKCTHGDVTDFSTTFSFNDAVSYFRPVTIDINSLAPGNAYTYTLTAYSNEGSEAISGNLRNSTTDVWQAQQPNKSFSFITGSCAFLDDHSWEKTGVLYKGDTSIFYRMAHTPSDFMLWLGDNWYTGEGEYNTEFGLLNKAHWTRVSPVMQMLQSSMPHYAIWDDHDYGPDDAGASYQLSKASRGVFMKYWPNPSYGEGGEGIYTKFNYNGVAFFLMDDRSFRSDEGKASYLDFSKRMFGQHQMEWLKRSLLENRDAPFKIIATGTQVLAHHANRDCMRRFPLEFKELMRFIADNHINGVVFLTGDRHFSEIVKEERKGHYPLYDITISSFSSTTEHPKQHERKDKHIVPGTLYEDHNFAHFSIIDGKKLHVDIINTEGQTVSQWEVNADQLAD